MDDTDKATALARSWDSNAASWTRVVRDGLIPSRQAGTDQAILQAVLEHRPRRFLDVGCGEGWLVRAVRARHAGAAVGIDGSAALVEAAQEADFESVYLQIDYHALADATGVGRDFDVVVFNYALFAADLTGLLGAAARLLAPDGVILIQTLHPGACAEAEEGWRIEDFAAFGGGAWQPMPWYFRSRESWRGAVEAAGLQLRDVREPMAADGRILSLLMICGQ